MLGNRSASAMARRLLSRSVPMVMVRSIPAGLARARNCGAAGATGDWLVFIDADSHPSRGLFGQVAEQIAGGKCLAGGSTMKLDGDYRWAGWAIRFWNRLSRWKRWAAGSFIFCE